MLALRALHSRDPLLFRATGETKKQGECVKGASSGGGYSLGSSDLSGGGNRSTDETHLWGVLRRRSSVTKLYDGDWRQCLDVASGYFYYSNSSTGESQWGKPAGLVEMPKIDDGGTNDGRAEEAGASDAEYNGWEAITTPQGDILYFYNYNTDEWTHDCPEAWDRLSYQTQWPKEEELAYNRDMVELKNQEAESIKSMKSIVSDLKELLTSAACLPVVTSVPAVEAVRVEVTEAMPASDLFNPDVFKLNPKELVSTLEHKKGGIFNELMVRAGVSKLKSTIEEQENLKKRRETMAMDKSRRISSGSGSAAKKEMRKRSMSIKPSSAREHAMWNVLMKASKPAGTDEGGKALYLHEKTGRVFSFDKVKGGAFLPAPVEYGDTVLTI